MNRIRYELYEIKHGVPELINVFDNETSKAKYMVWVKWKYPDSRFKEMDMLVDENGKYVRHCDLTSDNLNLEKGVK